MLVYSIDAKNEDVLLLYLYKNKDSVIEKFALKSSNRKNCLTYLDYVNLVTRIIV
jgi:hypothetical protein